MSTKEQYEKCVKYAADHGYYAMHTAMVEHGFDPEVDYEALMGDQLPRPLPPFPSLSVQKRIHAQKGGKMRDFKPAPHDWLEWVEPFGPNFEPAYMRVSKSTAIAHIKAAYAKAGHPEPSDEDALHDFMVVNWACWVDGGSG